VVTGYDFMKFPSVNEIRFLKISIVLKRLIANRRFHEKLTYSLHTQLKRKVVNKCILQVLRIQWHRFKVKLECN